MLYFVCACVHTSAYSSYADKCNLWVHYSHREGNMKHLRRLKKHMCCPLSHGYQWYPSCSSHNCKTISQLSLTQIYFWCLLIDVSQEFRTVFSMAFTVLVYEWLFFFFLIFTFSSLLAFCLFSLLFLFSLGMTFATISESSLCLFFFPVMFSPFLYCLSLF